MCEWRPHTNVIWSLSYNSSRNHFVSTSEQEIIVWEDMGEVRRGEGRGGGRERREKERGRKGEERE